MTISSNMPNMIREHFGEDGLKASMKMSNSLRNDPHQLSLCYNVNSRQFTVLDSGQIDPSVIREIFKKERYDYYRPVVLETRESVTGNILVKFGSWDYIPSVKDMHYVEKVYMDRRSDS